MGSRKKYYTFKGIFEIQVMSPQVAPPCKILIRTQRYKSHQNCFAPHKQLPGKVIRVGPNATRGVIDLSFDRR